MTHPLFTSLRGRGYCSPAARAAIQQTMPVSKRATARPRPPVAPKDRLRRRAVCAPRASDLRSGAFARAFEYIPNAYKKILEYLNANGFKENVSGEYLSCFEYVYEKDNTTYMEVCIHVDSVGYANLFTPLK